MVANVSGPRTWATEAGGSCIFSQPVLHSEKRDRRKEGAERERGRERRREGRREGKEGGGKGGTKSLSQLSAVEAVEQNALPTMSMPTEATPETEPFRVDKK